jgi:uncharacterized phiE125 gp8 family phage protein
MNYKITSQVEVEPISLEQAREHLRLDTFGSPEIHEDDNIVTALITASREWCEQYTRRALATQTITAVYDEFPTDPIELPLAPAQSVDSITYIDNDGATQTLATSVYTFNSYTNEIWLKYGQSYPSTRSDVNAVTITYTAGYTDEDSSPNNDPMPKPIYQAMLLMIGHLYEHREAVDLNNLTDLPMGVTILLQPYRLGLGV